MKFFKSKTRTALLVKFALSGKDEYYTRELERELKISIGNIRRELINLEKNGILKSRKIGNMKFYSLDKKSPIYHSLRDIIIKTVGIPELLKIPILKNKNIICAFIYGSYAKGNFDNLSDIDLFIVTDKNNVIFDKINFELDKLEQRFGREINIDIMFLTEFNTKIKEKNSYLNDIITGQKIFIKGGENDLKRKTLTKTDG